MDIIEVSSNKKQYIDLLLLADEQEDYDRTLSFQGQDVHS